ncbi:MAG: enoyl-CoA hydratase/isomerase family protein [Thermodesulfobacteriota bacterium]
MEYVQLSVDDGIATVAINRPKVNAINEQVVSELRDVFLELARDTGIRAVILTGKGSFFSFGFDIPGFMDYPKEAFHRFIMSFSDLVQRIFVFPKPVIAALNGHTVAGGCVLAIACDRRVMVTGKAKIALNELTLGASVFTSIAEILKFTVGPRKAQLLLYTGKMNSAEEALTLGLVDKVVSEEDINDAAVSAARELAGWDVFAFGSVKRLLRKDALDRIENHEKGSVSDFVDIWYSENTWEKLKKIEIRS